MIGQRAAIEMILKRTLETRVIEIRISKSTVKDPTVILLFLPAEWPRLSNVSEGKETQLSEALQLLRRADRRTKTARGLNLRNEMLLSLSHSLGEDLNSLALSAVPFRPACCCGSKFGKPARSHSADAREG